MHGLVVVAEVTTFELKFLRWLRFMERQMLGIVRGVLDLQRGRYVSAARHFARGADVDMSAALPKAEELWMPTEPLFLKIFSRGHRTALDILAADPFSEAERQVLYDFMTTNEFRWVKRINDLTRQRFQQAFSDWLREDGGKHISDLVERLSPYVGKTRAEAIAVTETNRAFNDAVYETWKASGMVRGLRYVTARDERVCKICRPLDGQESLIDSPAFTHPGGEGEAAQYAGQTFPLPPLHPRCRCHVEPILVEVAHARAYPQSSVVACQIY